MLVHSPVLVVSEVAQAKNRCLKRAIASAKSGINAGVSESDDIGQAVIIEVHDKAGMLVDSPASSLVSQVGDNYVGRLKASVTIA